jgi:hypothetical protein
MLFPTDSDFLNQRLWLSCYRFDKYENASNKDNRL